MADDKRSIRLFCVFSLSLLSLAEGTTYPPFELCAASNFDVRNLTSRLWRFSMPKQYCIPPKTGNMTADHCDITMAFCQPVTTPQSCANSSVCESYVSAQDAYNLGTYTRGSNPFNTTAISSSLGFRTQYANGEVYQNKTTAKNCTLITVMTFVCNFTAFWDKQTGNINQIPVKPTVEFTLGEKFCTYNFTFDFAGACPVITPSPPVTQLSAGSVLLLIFFVTVILYFVLGCFVNIARGKAGPELIPHHRFWAELPVYIMEGCQFCLACGDSKSNQSYERI